MDGWFILQLPALGLPTCISIRRRPGQVQLLALAASAVLPLPPFQPASQQQQQLLLSPSPPPGRRRP